MVCSNRTVRVEGSIKYNDRSLNEALRNKVAFVPQVRV